MPIFTGRNEVLAKVIFLHLFVILFKGRSGKENPLDMENPPLAWRPPPGMENPPRHGGTPLAWRTPPGKQTPAYGLRSAGTHPTGMHSCANFVLDVPFKFKRPMKSVTLKANPFYQLTSNLTFTNMFRAK